MLCPNCKKKISDKIPMCPFCGTRVAATPSGSLQELMKRRPPLYTAKPANDLTDTSAPDDNAAGANVDTVSTNTSAVETESAAQAAPARQNTGPTEGAEMPLSSPTVADAASYKDASSGHAWESRVIHKPDTEVAERIASTGMKALDAADARDTGSDPDADQHDSADGQASERQPDLPPSESKGPEEQPVEEPEAEEAPKKKRGLFGRSKNKEKEKKEKKKAGRKAFGLGRQKKEPETEPDPEPASEEPDETFNDPAAGEWNPNADGYYDDVLPLISEQINKLPVENIMRIVLTVAAVAIIVLILVL